MKLSEIKIDDRIIYFRDGTSDVTIINANIPHGEDGWKPEYKFPELPRNPNIIFDIGANIGITALMMHHFYPYAVIYCFEPETENYEILKKNVEGLDQINIFNFGLSNIDCSVTLKKSEQEGNFGGYSIYEKGTAGDHQEINLRSIQSVMDEHDIKQIDVIKIDCEGAEYSILTSIDLENVSWIEGECHGIKDYELLTHIAKTHTLGIEKPLVQRNFNFHALNKKYAPVNSF